MFRYVDATDQSVHFMSAARLVETDWSLPGTNQLGFMRTVCRGFMGSGASLGIGIMPIGQRSPKHDATGEHLLLGLEGQLTWRVEGHGDFVMGPMDLLFIGEGQVYEYFNSGWTTARFVDVIGRVNMWPHSASYEDPDNPGGDKIPSMY